MLCNNTYMSRIIFILGALLQWCYLVSLHFSDNIGRVLRNLSTVFTVHICTYRERIMKTVSDYKASSLSEIVFCNFVHKRKMGETTMFEFFYNCVMYYIPLRVRWVSAQCRKVGIFMCTIENKLFIKRS